MLSYSRVIQKVKSSSTLLLNAKAQSLSQEGKKIINLTIGEPDFRTPDIIVKAAIDALNNGKTKYGKPGGSISLKESIINKLYRENSIQYNVDEVVAGIGAKEILFHIFLSMLNKDDEVLIFAPYWVSYVDQVIAAGGVPIIVPFNEALSLDDIFSYKNIEQLINRKTKAIVLNYPNNPSGYILDTAVLERIADIVKKVNCWLICDEIYEYFSFEHKHISILNIVPELRSKVILVNGLSKSFAMTGWRVGYACCVDKKLIKYVETLQSQSSTCIPPFIEDAAVCALQHGYSLVDKDIQMIKDRRDLVCSELSKISNISYIEPQGAFYVFINIKEVLKNSKKLSSKTSFGFCQMLLEQYNVAVVPGDVFGVEGYIRMSYTINEDSLISAMKFLKQACEGC